MPETGAVHHIKSRLVNESQSRKTVFQE